ncbi:MAG TPA: hypothetical protein VK013_13680 [Myxococcaceae bacterium]|nr:hypothetical protein [Myxococcaceae bacterium]
MKIEILAGWVCLGLMTAVPVARASEVPGEADGLLSQEALEDLAFGIDVTVQPGLRWFPEDSLNRAGTVLDLGLHLRFSGDYSLGVEGGFGLPSLLGDSPRDMQAYKVVGRAGGPMSQLWFELGAGVGQQGRSSRFSHAGLSLKAGLQFIPVTALSGLSVGLFAGGEAWWSTETCGSSPCVDLTRAPLFAVQAGLSLRFVLPLIRHAGGY